MNADSAEQVRLPSLSAGQARALTTIAVRSADLRVSLPALDDADAAPGVWRVGLTPGASDALLRAASHRVDLKWAGTALRLRLPPDALTAWVDARLPDLGPGDMPEALRAAALETLLAEVITALSSSSPGGPVRVVISADAMQLPHIWTLTAVAQERGETALAVLEADDMGLMLLADLLGRAQSGAMNAIDESALPVLLRAVLGWARLPVAELRALGAGDVVLLDEYLVGPGGELWLGIPRGQGLRVRAEQSSYLVTQGWTSLMTPTDPSAEDVSSFDSIDLDDDTETEPSDFDDHRDAEPMDVDKIPVRLTFDLGDRVMTLAELRQLRPGAVFDLSRPLSDGPVMIRANGALIGTGDLVEVDGRIGVRVGVLSKGAQ